MNCQDAKTMLHDQIDGYLEADDLRLIEQHLLSCTNCKRLQQETIQTKQQLNNLPKAEADQALLDRIRQQRKLAEGEKRSVFTVTRVAMAVSLVMVALLLPIVIDTTNNNSNLAQTTIITALKQPSNVNFLVTAKEAVNNVTFSLSVPPELALYGYSGKQQLSWRGKLKQGNNLLTIPVMAIEPKSGTLVMKIQHKTESKEYKVIVDVQEDKVQLYNIINKVTAIPLTIGVYAKC